ncbi:MAG: ammonium transporter, partial [Acidimicrobiaceae bacterium]|nr:ammonium transporter [Acidimicrobiaceae bacterium]
FSFVATYIIAKIMDRTIGLRVTESTEMAGLDASDHGEAAYVMES